MEVWDFTFFMYIFCIEGSTDFFEDMALRSTLSLERHIIFGADFSDLDDDVSHRCFKKNGATFEIKGSTHMM